MKKKILMSLAIGLTLTVLSLARGVGIGVPMVPCAGIGPGCVPGVVINTPPTSVEGYRGFPAAILYLQTDEDGNSTYEGYSVSGFIADLALYTIACFLILLAFSSKSKKSLMLINIIPPAMMVFGYLWTDIQGASAGDRLFGWGFVLCFVAIILDTIYWITKGFLPNRRKVNKGSN